MIFADNNIVIKISANTLITEQYNTFVGNMAPWNYTDYRAKDIHRGTVELILFAKALKAGGLDFSLKIMEAPNYSRALNIVEENKADAPAETIWLDDINRDIFYVSDPIFRNGEIELGVYVKPSNREILQVRSLVELRKYSAVSSDKWVMNWNTLGEMGIKRHSTPKMELMYRMVDRERVDFYLTEFTSKDDFASIMDDIRLIPIPGIKVGLNSSRHFVILKESDNGALIYETLQNGLKILRESGEIRHAFESSGCLDKRVKDWIRIYP